MILFEDEHYIIVNKPALLLIHPYKKESTEKDNLMARVRDMLGNYVYVVNRLDRPVSGIVVFGKTPDAVKRLKESWHTNLVQKKYIALARSRFLESGVFDFDLNNEKKIPKAAKTIYHPLKVYDSATLMEVEILTGRHHQIRRHFARSVRHLLGDRTYGKKKYNDYYLENFGLERVFLHAHRFKFTHPYTLMIHTINCPLPADLNQVLAKMNVELLEKFDIPDYITLYE